MTTRWWVIAAILGLIIVGCDEETVTPTPEQDLFSSTWVMDGVTQQEFIDGLRLVLYDVDEGRPVATTVSVNGWAEVDVESSGHYRWFIVPGQGWIPREFPEPAMITDRNQDIIYPMVAAIFALPSVPGDEPIIAGTVVDDLTGDPVPNAVVGHPGWPTAWDGLDESTSDVTDDDGAFRVADVFFAVDPGGSGEPVQVVPLVFQADGYRPRALSFDLPGDGYEVRLTPLGAGAEARGSLVGRVVDRDGPVAGVGVVGSWLRDGDKAWLGHPGVTTETDADGRFRLDDLPPGYWTVQPAPLPFDGWTPVIGVSVPATVAAGDTTDMGDQWVLPGITPRSPLPGATHVDSLPTFRWTAVAEADSYDVFVGRWYLGRTSEPELTVLDEFPLEQGTWSWYVSATNLEGEQVGLMETRFRFVVGPFAP